MTVCSRCAIVMMVQWAKSLAILTNHELEVLEENNASTAVGELIRENDMMNSPSDCLLDKCVCLHVHSCGRLVQKNNFRFSKKCSSQANKLSLPDGQVTSSCHRESKLFHDEEQCVKRVTKKNSLHDLSKKNRHRGSNSYLLGDLPSSISYSSFNRRFFR